MAGAGALKEYYDFAKDEIEKVKAMSPEDRKAYNESLMDEGGMLASGGRVGYADGPEDPSKELYENFRWYCITTYYWKIF